MKAPEHYIELAKEVDSFLQKHACIRPDFSSVYEPESEKFTSPDAAILYAYSYQLKQGIAPGYPFSSWSSGGYKPWNDKKARVWHDELVEKISRIR